MTLFQGLPDPLPLKQGPGRLEHVRMRTIGRRLIGIDVLAIIPASVRINCGMASVFRVIRREQHIISTIDPRRKTILLGCSGRAVMVPRT
jgi:hypothetical protein